MDISSSLKALLLGLIEGATEFLPISSTGHLIFFGHLIRFDEAYSGVFDIVPNTIIENSTDTAWCVHTDVLRTRARIPRTLIRWVTRLSDHLGERKGMSHTKSARRAIVPDPGFNLQNPRPSRLAAV